jgi:hypothetical protein
MKQLLLIPTFFLIVFGFQSCNLPSTLLNPGSPAKVSFSSTKLSNNSLKPCGGSLAPGESCALQVQFTPSSSGVRSGSLQIRSNGEVLEEVALTGQGDLRN